jgi:hypothetical protein
MRTSVSFLVVFASVGCNDAIQCGSTQGFVFGDVTGGASAPLQVFATAAGLNTLFEGEVSADDTYELNLEGGFDYTIWAEDADDNTSVEHDLSLEACEEVELDLGIVAD